MKGVVAAIIVAAIGIAAAVGLYSSATSRDEQQNSNLNDVVDRCESWLQAGNEPELRACDDYLIGMMEDRCAENGNYDICNNQRIENYYRERGSGGVAAEEIPTSGFEVSANAPNVKFAEFTPEKTDLIGSGSTPVLYSVENLESQSITPMVTIIIEPRDHSQYFWIQPQIRELPALDGGSLSSQMKFRVGSSDLPAEEVKSQVKAVLFADGWIADIKEFTLTARE